MRVPDAVTKKIAELGRRVLDEEASEVDIGEEGALWLEAREHIFALDVLADWWRKRTRSWIYQETRQALRTDDDESEQLMLPFAELPPYLEVSPGRKAHQSVMTGHDWDNTLAIYRNRRDQAEVLFRQIERVYNIVRPLLDGDITTSDVLGQLRPPDDATGAAS